MFLSNEAKGNLRSGGGSVSTLLSGVGSYFSSSHKTLCLMFIGLGAVFLLITIYFQMYRKSKTALPIHVLTGAAVLMLFIGGWKEVNRKPPPDASAPARQSGPTNTAPVSTTGDNAPAIGAGNGNTITYAAPPDPQRKPKKK